MVENPGEKAWNTLPYVFRNINLAFLFASRVAMQGMRPKPISHTAELNRSAIQRRGTGSMDSKLFA
jgi:hypothetical protein